MPDGVGQQEHIHESGGMLFGACRWRDLWRLRERAEAPGVRLRLRRAGAGCEWWGRAARARMRRSPVGWCQVEPTRVPWTVNGLPTDAEIKRRSRVMVRISLRVAQQSPWSSGVVVAGFGADQFFPAVSHHLVDGVVAGRVRTWRASGVCIGTDQSAGIYPFAQEDMVATFMDGIHPDYRSVLEEFVDQTISIFAQYFGDQVQGSLSPADHAELLDEMGTARATVVHHFQDRLDDFLKAHNSDPIMSIVELLPKEELAEMAEALVNLTSFKRRVTPEAETVGAPSMWPLSRRETDSCGSSASTTSRPNSTHATLAAARDSEMLA